MDPHYYKPKGITFGVNPYYKPKGTAFWCKCGSLLVCSNKDPHYYKPKRNHILVGIHITTNQKEQHFGVNVVRGSFWLVVIWVHITTNQKEPRFGVHPYYYKPTGARFWYESTSPETKGNHILV